MQSTLQNIISYGIIIILTSLGSTIGFFLSDSDKTLDWLIGIISGGGFTFFILMLLIHSRDGWKDTMG